jgi:hypothetical protein
MVPGCGKTFSTAGNLTRHTRNQHSGSSVADAMHRDGRYEHRDVDTWATPLPFDREVENFNTVFTDEVVELLQGFGPETASRNFTYVQYEAPTHLPPLFCHGTSY